MAERPPSGLFFSEPFRAISGLGTYMRYLPALKRYPPGDGHPVMVIPGFMASDLSTRPMRNLFKHLGYRTYTWGQGRNLAKEEYEPLLKQRLEELYTKHGRKLSLIGWSLGGVFAREIARSNPEMVRQVITLVSPFAGINEPNNAARMFKMVSGKNLKDLDPELVERISKPIPVPTTNLYSKKDGIVSWETCKEDIDNQTENLEFDASHVGMGHDPCVLLCVIERLSQKEGEWEPFDTKLPGRYFGGKLCKDVSPSDTPKKLESGDE